MAETNLSAIPESMLNRTDGTLVTPSVMDEIYTIKVYNKNPREKGEPDPEKAGNFLYKNKETNGEYEIFSDKIKINILAIKKILSGFYNILDENGSIIKEGNEVQKGLAYTNEFSRFTRRTDKVLFKDMELEDKFGQEKAIMSIELGKLQDTLREEKVNGKPNRFYKIGLNSENETYDSSFIVPSFMLYGQIIDGPQKGELFKFIVSSSSFGSYYENGIYNSKPDSLQDALDKGLELFNKYIKLKGVNGRFSDSLVTCDLSVKQDGKFFKPVFTNVELMLNDNTEAYNRINEIQEEYFQEKFGAFNKDNNDTAGKHYFEPKGAIEEPKATEQEAPKQYAQPADTRTETEENPKATSNRKIPEFKKSNTVQDDDISIEDMPF